VELVIWDVISLQTLCWEIGDKSRSWNKMQLPIFLLRGAMHSAYCAVTRCLSVRPSVCHTPSDLAKYSMTRSTARSLCDSWASCQRTYYVDVMTRISRINQSFIAKECSKDKQLTGRAREQGSRALAAALNNKKQSTRYSEKSTELIVRLKLEDQTSLEIP